MNTLYKKYLSCLHILLEEDFDKILEIVPIDLLEKCLGKTDIYGYFENYSNIDDVATEIINLLVYDKRFVYCEEISVEKRMMYLADVENLEDLEEIKNRFPKLTISNYEGLKRNLEEQEKQKILDDERAGKEAYLEYLRVNCSLDTIKSIVNAVRDNIESSLNKTKSYAN